MKDFAGSAPRKKHSRPHSGRPAAVSRFTRLLFRGLLAISGVVLLLLLIRSLRWADFIHSPDQQTVLFLAEKVDQTGGYILHFLPEEQRIDVYPVPSELPVEVAGGYGTYRFQAVYPLLVLENKDDVYIRSALSLSMGALLDELWKADTARLVLDTPFQLQQLLLRNFFSNHQLSFSEKAAWLALAADQRTEYVLHEPLTVLPSPVLQEMYAPAEESECTVALVNTTSLSGLAGRIAGLLESHGFRVVRTVSDTTSVEKTRVLFSEQQSVDCALILEKIEKLVPGGVEQQTDNAETLRHRADLVVRLGTDLVQ